VDFRLTLFESTRFSELLMLFEIVNIWQFPFPVQQNASVALEVQDDFTNFRTFFVSFLFNSAKNAHFMSVQNSPNQSRYSKYVSFRFVYI
jgi:3-methyladenine DNA glycosylase Tag